MQNAKIYTIAKSELRKEQPANPISRDFAYFQNLLYKTSRNIQKISNYFHQE
jgi:hypothetical protein